MRRAVIMVPAVPLPQAGDGDDVCFFEVYSAAGDDRYGIGHDFFPGVPEGETWGSDHLHAPFNHAVVLEAVSAAFPQVRAEWRGRLVVGHCQELLEARQQVRAARAGLQAALAKLEEAEQAVLLRVSVRMVDV